MTSLFDLPPDRPPEARGRAVARTSRSAARSMAGHVRGQQRRLLAFLAERGAIGATNEEAAVALGMRTASQTARCRELQLAGLVADSGHTRTSSSGRAAIVWTITEAGRAALERGRTA